MTDEKKNVEETDEDVFAEQAREHERKAKELRRERREFFKTADKMQNTLLKRWGITETSKQSMQDTQIFEKLCEAYGCDKEELLNLLSNESLISYIHNTYSDEGAVETPDDDPIETVGTLSKSRFQTYMGENQNATELTFDAVSYDGMAYTDVSEEQNGSVLAFMDGDTMHVTAANGGKVGLPADCDSLFYGYLPNAIAFNMSNCDTSSVMEMRGMFDNCNFLINIHGLED